MMLMLAVFSLGAYAQTQQGQSAVGFNIGYGFDSKNATLGVDYRYCITDAVRLSPSLTYFVKNDNHSTWAIDLNAHYVVKLSEMFYRFFVYLHYFIFFCLYYNRIFIFLTLSRIFFNANF